MKYVVESSEGHFGPFDDEDVAAEWARLLSPILSVADAPRLQAPQGVQVAAITEGPHR